VPGVPPLLARLAEGELLGLQLPRPRIEVGRAEQDLIRSRPEERAGRLAVAGRDALRLARREVEHVDLVERVAGLALALEDELPAVGGPVALACAAPFDRQPPDAAQERRFGKVGRRRLRSRPGSGPGGR